MMPPLGNDWSLGQVVVDLSLLFAIYVWADLAYRTGKGNAGTFGWPWKIIYPPDPDWAMYWTTSMVFGWLAFFNTIRLFYRWIYNLPEPWWWVMLYVVQTAVVGTMWNVWRGRRIRRRHDKLRQERGRAD